MTKLNTTKAGVCSRYSSPKTKYFKYTVANFDCGVLSSKHPNTQFRVFKCPYCKHWHIGSKRKRNRKKR